MLLLLFLQIGMFCLLPSKQHLVLVGQALFGKFGNDILGQSPERRRPKKQKIATSQVMLWCPRSEYAFHRLVSVRALSSFTVKGPDDLLVSFSVYLLPLNCSFLPFQLPFRTKLLGGSFPEAPDGWLSFIGSCGVGMICWTESSALWFWRSVILWIFTKSLRRTTQNANSPSH